MVRETSAPWAYHRGEPYRVIAALEALGVLLATVAFKDFYRQNLNTTIVVGGITDNKGNSYVLNRLMTTKFPLCAVVMELAAQMERHNLRVSIDWAPREWNAEADDLSNNLTAAFDPIHRINLDLNSVPWIVLTDLMRDGSEYERRRAQAIPGRAAKRKAKGERLRDTDPW